MLNHLFGDLSLQDSVPVTLFGTISSKQTAHNQPCDSLPCCPCPCPRHFLDIITCLNFSRICAGVRGQERHTVHNRVTGLPQRCARRSRAEPNTIMSKHPVRWRRPAVTSDERNAPPLHVHLCGAPKLQRTAGRAPGPQGVVPAAAVARGSPRAGRAAAPAHERPLRALSAADRGPFSESIWRDGPDSGALEC